MERGDGAEGGVTPSPSVRYRHGAAVTYMPLSIVRLGYDTATRGGDPKRRGPLLIQLFILLKMPKTAKDLFCVSCRRGFKVQNIRITFKQSVP